MLPRFPDRLHLAQLPTPLRPLDRLSEQLKGPRIWLKCDDMTGSLLSGNKVRKLEFTLADATASGADTIITCGGLQSNHCRATAIAGAQLGFNVHLILRGNESEAQISDGNLLLDQLAGANISIYPPGEYFSQLQSLFEGWDQHYREQGQIPYCIPTGASDAVGIWGYIAASYELTQDFNQLQLNPELIVCPTGSGGTQAGLTLGFALQNSPVQVFGMAVCDSSQYFFDKVSKDISDWKTRYRSIANNYFNIENQLSINTIDSYIGPGYAQGYSEVFETIELLAKEEGIVLDPVYTGKAFYGMLAEIKAGSFRNYHDIVFVHTGGIYGLFPYKNEFDHL